ncbi:hypothetical protein [Actinocrispum wychmicini]|uniref:Galactokinase n=1 Tax=Actinocrispum wychmicini TaxID=1213861 RepID=A0A4R2J5R1_9PSEU|nr:hypothetical protein [Actinocrispum wychmicini]TCO53694.1 galactokinase [Actinocrispum wychmicini]
MTDLADRPDVSPELRLVPHAFREAFGRSAEGVWYAPGVVPLMPGMSVCARWGAIVAGERRTDRMLELVSINRPAEPVRVPLNETVDLPKWARPVAGIVKRLEPTGATLLCSVDLPAGSGLSSPNALACVAAIALRDLGRPDLSDDDLLALIAECAPHAEAAFAGHTTGLNLDGTSVLVIDTRLRSDTPVTVVDYPTSDFPGTDNPSTRLTVFHRAQTSTREQDLAVAAALDAGADGASMLVDEPGRPVAALADPTRISTVRAYVSDAFRSAELRVPRYLTVRPAAGAVRITA